MRAAKVYQVTLNPARKCSVFSGGGIRGQRVERLPEVQGPVQPARPWVMYEYADPALQRLSAGQKLLLRVSPDQRARLKLRLVQWRELVTARAGTSR